MSRWSDPDYDPPSRDELAREVLDAEEYGEWRREQDERLLARSVKRARDRVMRSHGNPWDDDYRGPGGAA